LHVDTLTERAGYIARRARSKIMSILADTLHFNNLNVNDLLIDVDQRFELSSFQTTIAYEIPRRFLCIKQDTVLANRNNYARIQTTDLIGVSGLISLGGTNMSFIADIATIGSSIFAVLFCFWMLKQLFTSN
jgi:hypothetical protein